MLADEFSREIRREVRERQSDNMFLFLGKEFKQIKKEAEEYDYPEINEE